MRKWLRHADGTVVELSPISYKEFMCIDQWKGASDMAYEAWLRFNGYVDPLDYSEETLEQAHFYVSFSPVDRSRFMFKTHGEDEPAMAYRPEPEPNAIPCGAIHLKR